MQTGMRVKDMKRGPKIQQCEERFTQLVGDIFIGNELVPVSILLVAKCPGLLLVTSMFAGHN